MAMVLKSPSSPSTMSNIYNSNCSYDVFLSFRGEDTRKAFTDHLYKALNQAGIRTFRDDDAMERGRFLKPELEKAIRQSQVLLIVLSKIYATSKWCLDEVRMIMEKFDNKRLEVVPVFYNIKPTTVRNHTGCFEDAFKGYYEEVTKETNVEKKKELAEKVEAWRSFLRKAGSLTGMVLPEDGYEAEFISNVVKVIRKKLNYNALYIDEKLVGITENIAKIESWLQDPSPNAVIYVIDGMGGIGKTTVAKCVYNSNFREYDCSCFLANICDASSHSNGMLRLQSQLLSTILKSEKEETVWNEYEGTTKIIDAVCKKKVLLVLDDVTTSQQLNALLGPQRFYPGSKVIITTRHKSLMINLNVHP
uniref:disease resistance protein RUN1-like n=1 Tax=Erigeron canadensis TaxID=72917 RepID=UPI001CB8BD71|nr:disease resistance protein RUN1-like [Erigeron canadensis]